MSVQATQQPEFRPVLPPVEALEIDPERRSDALIDSAGRQYLQEDNGTNGRTRLRRMASTLADRSFLPSLRRLDGGRRHSYTLLSKARAVQAGLGAALPAMLAEEHAYGHSFLALPVFVGIGATSWFALPVEPAPLPVAVAFLTSAVLSLFLRWRHGWLRHVLLVVTFFFAGMLLAACENWRMATVVLDQSVTTVVTGIVEMREPSGEGRWRYVIALEATDSPKLRRQPERITVISRGRETVFGIGDRIRGRARISPPSGPALTGLADFAFMSYFDGIGAIGFFYGTPALVDGPVVAGWGQQLERTFFAWRSAIASRIRDTVPGDAGAFAAAIVTDERRAISGETTEALRVSGLAHIVAISGLNMALAAGIFFVGMRSLFALLPGFAQAFPVKKLAAAAALLMATGYYLISGFGVSAERAYIMMAIMLAAVFFDRPSISLRNVALAALVVLVISPSEILGPSFQMSFAATVALVAGYSAWSRRRDEEDEPLRRPAALKPVFALGNLAGGVFMTSLIGGLSTAIFSIDHFHRISTYGLAANLAAMPLVSFIVMPFGLVGMLLMPFGLDGPFLQIMGMGLDGVIVVARTVAGWGGDVAIGRQSSWFLPVGAAGLLVLTLLRTRLHLCGMPLLVLAIALSWRAGRDPPPDFLVSEDGSLVALLQNGQVFTNRTRPPGFIYSQWRHALSLPVPTAPIMQEGPWPKGGPAGAPGGSSSLGRVSEMPKSTGVPAAIEVAVEDGQRPLPGDRPPREGPKKREPLGAEDQAGAREAMRKALNENVAGTFVCASRAWCVAKAVSGPTIAVVEDARFAGPACDVVQMVVAARARFDRCRSGALMVNGEALRRTGTLEIRFQGRAEPEKWSVATAMADTDRSWMQHRQYDWRRGVFDPALPEPLRRLSGRAEISGSGE